MFLISSYCSYFILLIVNLTGIKLRADIEESQLSGVGTPKHATNYLRSDETADKRRRRRQNESKFRRRWKDLR